MFQKVFVIGSMALFGISVAWVVREGNPPWRQYQLAYHEWLTVNSPEPAPLPLHQQPFFGLQQINVVSMQRIDRCMVCHPGVEDPRAKTAPPMFRYEPIHTQHPREEFGCTICHRGQGRATEVRDAHGEAPHWDTPLLRGEYLQASCSQCHREPLPKQAPLMIVGKRLYSLYGCSNCHRLNNAGRQVGPDLDGIGGKSPGTLVWGEDERPRTLIRWLQRHFKDPRAFQSNSTMTNFHLNDATITALTVYMLSLTTNDIPSALLPQRKRPEQAS